MDNVNCNICGSRDLSILYGNYATREGRIDIVKCQKCGLVFNNPRHSPDEIASYYDEDYYGINSMRFIGIIEKFIRFKRRLRASRIRRLVSSGRVLDIGCGRGIFLNEMRERKFETYGTEFSATGAKYATEILHLNIQTGDVEKLKFQDSFFDVIAIYHVLEHLRDPSSTINEVRRILRPGGLLLIAVPNIDSWQARIFGSFWFHLDVPRHYYHFSKDTLDRILPAAEWDVVWTRKFSFEHGPFGWIQSAANMISGKRENLLYNILKEKTSGTMKEYVTRRFKSFRWTLTLLNLVFAAVLTLPAVLISLLAVLADRNEIIEIYYRKKQ